MDFRADRPLDSLDDLTIESGYLSRDLEAQPSTLLCYALGSKKALNQP
jgi:hypothetical protein